MAQKEEQHHTDVEPRGTGPRRRYIAKCSCGWMSDEIWYQDLAEDAATDHVVAATRGAR